MRVRSLESGRRRGLTLLEAVFAVVILVTAGIPLLELSVSSTRVTAGGARRMVLEHRARRHQAEIASTPYVVCRSLQEAPWPLSLADPDEPDGLAPYLDGIGEGTTVFELEPGLMAVLTRIDFQEQRIPPAPRMVLSGRLKVDPTWSLKARYRR